MIEYFSVMRKRGALNILLNIKAELCLVFYKVKLFS